MNKDFEAGYRTALEDLEQFGRVRCGAWDFAFVYGLLAYLRRKFASRRIDGGG